MRILIIDFDPPLLATLSDFCEREGHISRCTNSRRQATSLLLKSKYDCVLLDLDMIGGTILKILNESRMKCKSGDVIVMDEHKSMRKRLSELPPTVDYIPKPFFLEELGDRLQSIHRRKRRTGEWMEYGNVRCDSNEKAAYVSGVHMQLTTKEFEILHCLLLHKTAIISAEILIECVWANPDKPGSPSLLFAHIKNLKRKLIVAGATFGIKNVYGVGYRIAEPDSTPE